MRQLKINNSITERNGETIERYFRDVSSHGTLSSEDEASLMKRIKNGDKTAREKLIVSNLKFVISVAKQYTGSGVSLNDLINEGNLGLVKAVERFDETKGFKFISYAVWWIRQSIIQAIMDKSGIVKLPANRKHDLRKVEKERKELEQKYGRDLSSSEVEALGTANCKNYHLDNMFNSSHISLETTVKNESDENDLTVKGMLQSDDYEKMESKYEKEQLVKNVRKLLGEMNFFEKEVLKRFYGIDGFLPRSYEEISFDMNLSRERVRQIKYRAIKKLRKKKSQLIDS